MDINFLKEMIRNTHRAYGWRIGYAKNAQDINDWIDEGYISIETADELALYNHVNHELSVGGCWQMVNRIQLADSGMEMRRRCVLCEVWLFGNEVITTDEFDELMRAVSQCYRDSYKLYQCDDVSEY